MGFPPQVRSGWPRRQALRGSGSPAGPAAPVSAVSPELGWETGVCSCPALFRVRARLEPRGAQPCFGTLSWLPFLLKERLRKGNFLLHGPEQQRLYIEDGGQGFMILSSDSLLLSGQDSGSPGSAPTIPQGSDEGSFLCDSMLHCTFDYLESGRPYPKAHSSFRSLQMQVSTQVCLQHALPFFILSITYLAVSLFAHHSSQ